MTLDANMNTSDIEERFERIAKMLFECFAIQKGNTIYHFKEIDFTSTIRIIVILSPIHVYLNHCVGM